MILWRDNSENETHKERFRKHQSLSKLPPLQSTKPSSKWTANNGTACQKLNFFDVLFIKSTFQSEETKHSPAQRGSVGGALSHKEKGHRVDCQ